MSVKALTTHVRNANTAEEKVLAEKVQSIFTDATTQEAAVRYGRKLLRVKEGKRTSAPPLAGLSKNQAAQVAAALGIEKKAAAPKKAAAKKQTAAKKPAAEKTTEAPKDETVAASNGEVPADASAEVTPDPKPAKSEKPARRTLAR